MKPVSCCQVFLTILIPPLGLYCIRGKCDNDNLLNLLLSLILVPIFSCSHAFYLLGMDLLIAVLCFWFAPLGVLVGTGDCCKTFICFLLLLLGIVPGVIYAYYTCMDSAYMA